MKPFSGRQPTVLLAVVAMLFQAVLFGWHTHPVPVPSHDPVGISAAHSNTPASPFDADDGCEICAALHHHGAVPLTLATLPPPPVVPTPAAPRATRVRPGGVSQGFHARAPPRA